MKYQITIPKPCHEDWTKMTETQKGKFCKSCHKEVIDFTKLSTTAISKKVLNEDNLCGRFKNTQLNKEIEIIQRSNVTKIAASAVLVAAISVLEPIFSQPKKETTVVVNHIQGKFILKDDRIEKFIILRGKIIDASGDLPGVDIKLKGTNISTETDFDGKFSIKIPNKKRDSTILVIYYLGFKTQEIDVLQIKKPLLIEMKEDSAMLGEIITVGYVSVHKNPNIFKWVGNLFRKKENKR